MVAGSVHLFQAFLEVLALILPNITIEGTKEVRFEHGSGVLDYHPAPRMIRGIPLRHSRANLREVL